MKKARYTLEQVAFGLRRAEEGTPVEVCRKMGISEQTFHRWKKKLPGHPSQRNVAGTGAAKLLASTFRLSPNPLMEGVRLVS